MKILITSIMLIACSLTYAEMENAIQLKSGVFSSGGLTNNYVEVLKDGSNHLASISQTTQGKEIGLWFDQNRTLSMVDTNNDGRTDRITFMVNYIPTMVFDRGENDILTPIAPDELKKMQGFAKTMASEFPKAIAAAKSSNEDLFWGTISNIVSQE